MSEWGKPCLSCGHPSDYHGVTFCMVKAGGAYKRDCDCKRYANPAAAGKQGICGAPNPFADGGWCDLTVGHFGWHENDKGKWSGVPESVPAAVGDTPKTAGNDA